MRTLLVVVFVVAMAPRAGHACSCASRTVESAMEHASAIFEGVVVDVRRPWLDGPGARTGLPLPLWAASYALDPQIETDVATTSWWKGEPREVVTVTSSLWVCCNCMPGPIGALGETVRVFAYGSPEALVVPSSCSQFVDGDLGPPLRVSGVAAPAACPRRLLPWAGDASQALYMVSLALLLGAPVWWARRRQWGRRAWPAVPIGAMAIALGWAVVAPPIPIEGSDLPQRWFGALFHVRETALAAALVLAVGGLRSGSPRLLHAAAMGVCLAMAADIHLVLAETYREALDVWWGPSARSSVAAFDAVRGRLDRVAWAAIACTGIALLSARVRPEPQLRWVSPAVLLGVLSAAGVFVHWDGRLAENAPGTTLRAAAYVDAGDRTPTYPGFSSPRATIDVGFVSDRPALSGSQE